MSTWPARWSRDLQSPKTLLGYAPPATLDTVRHNTDSDKLACSPQFTTAPAIQKNRHGPSLQAPLPCAPKLAVSTSDSAELAPLALIHGFALAGICLVKDGRGLRSRHRVNANRQHGAARFRNRRFTAGASSKIRRSSTLPHVLDVSGRPLLDPAKTSNPRPISPMTCPSTRTRAEVTR